MEKIIEQVSKWEFLRNLPAEIYGFTLINELMACGTQYRIFTYNNPNAHRSFTIMYDTATKDFLARTVVGLTEFCDISYITGDLTSLEKLLAERMENTLKCLAYFEPSSVCVRFREKKVLEWPYISKLPSRIQNFELFINPHEPVKVLNGSYAIIDYSDFSTESNLMINYNIFRDEFFCEIRLRRTPIMTADFDAKTLVELEARLESNLLRTIENLDNRLQNS
jgi:hypothetical protein